MSNRRLSSEIVLVAALVGLLLVLYALIRDREYVRLAGEALAALYALLHITRREAP